MFTKTVPLTTWKTEHVTKNLSCAEMDIEKQNENGCWRLLCCFEQPTTGDINPGSGLASLQTGD